MSEMKKRQSWEMFYSAHSPVQYSEMIERWGGEDELWRAYAEGRMERKEADYFESPRIFSAARAFANVVLPAVRKITTDGAAAYSVFEQLEARVKELEVKLQKVADAFGVELGEEETPTTTTTTTTSSGAPTKKRRAAATTTTPTTTPTMTTTPTPNPEDPSVVPE